MALYKSPRPFSHPSPLKKTEHYIFWPSLKRQKRGNSVNLNKKTDKFYVIFDGIRWKKTKSYVKSTKKSAKKSFILHHSQYFHI